MEYQKVFKTLIALFLILSVFANIALAEFCFCGKACLHGPRSKTKIKVNSLFHLRCPGTLCKSCNLEKGQTLRAANSATQTLNVKILDTAFILSPLLVYPSTYHILKDFDSFYLLQHFLFIRVFNNDLQITIYFLLIVFKDQNVVDE